MSETTAEFPITRFCRVWAESFSSLLGSLGVVSPVAESSDPIPAQAPTHEEFEKLVCIRFTGGGVLKGELLWVADKPAALQLAQLFKSEPADPAAEFAETHRDAFGEFLREVAGHTATAWKAEMAAEIELVFQSTVEPEPVTAQSINLRLGGEKFAELSLRLFLDADLCVALSTTPPRTPVETPKQSVELSSVSSPAPRTTPLPVNLGLVLDVELEATIRFGEREMLLRDIFGLMAGAVVELNQMVNEPAELLVAGRLVARGEVVVVDGNFGLRVTEVASVNERVAAIPL